MYVDIYKCGFPTSIGTLPIPPKVSIITPWCQMGDMDISCGNETSSNTQYKEAFTLLRWKWKTYLKHARMQKKKKNQTQIENHRYIEIKTYSQHNTRETIIWCVTCLHHCTTVIERTCHSTKELKRLLVGSLLNRYRWCVTGI